MHINRIFPHRDPSPSYAFWEELSRRYVRRAFKHRMNPRVCTYEPFALNDKACINQHDCSTWTGVIIVLPIHSLPVVPVFMLWCEHEPNPLSEKYETSTVTDPNYFLWYPQFRFLNRAGLPPHDCRYVLVAKD